MKLLAKGVQVNLKLEDKNTGVLYANCPVETYPGIHIHASKINKTHSIILDAIHLLCDDLQIHEFIPIFMCIISIFFLFLGVAIEAVSDSSRYFVIRVVDDNGK